MAEWEDAPSLPRGQLSAGNIDLNNRPIVRNSDGSISTVRSMSANFDGKEYLIPTVSDEGTILEDDAAIERFLKTGKHLGVFDTPDNATSYAESLHHSQASQYGDSGWEDAPWEDSPQASPGLLGQVGGAIGQFGKNVGGLATGLADMAVGSVTAPLAALQAQYEAMGGTEDDYAAARQRMQQNVSNLSPSSGIAALGLGDPRENETYQNSMVPFEKLQQGLEAGVSALGGGQRATLGAELLTSVLPIPGMKLAGKGFRAAAGAIDPGLRTTEFKRPAPLPDNTPVGPMESQRIAEREQATFAEQQAQQAQREAWAFPDEQGDMMQPVNPYDVGGNVTAFNEGRTTQIDPMQPELGGRIDDTTSVPEQVYRDIQEQIARETQTGVLNDFRENAFQQEMVLEQPTQGELWDTMPEQRALGPEAPQSAYQVSIAHENAAEPPIVTQQFRDAAESIPGLDNIDNSDVTVKPPVRDQALTPAQKVAKDIPVLGENNRMFEFGTLEPDQIIANALNESDGGTSKYNYSGANLGSMIRKSSLVQGAYNIMNAAENATRNVTLKRLVPMERTMQRLNANERQALSGVLKGEMLNRAVITDAELAMQPPRVREAYKKFREENAHALERTNQAREVAGLKPITPQDFHVASRWIGNFKAEVRGPDGKLLYMLREPSKRALNTSKEALKDRMNGVVFKDLPEAPRGSRGADSFEAGYNDMLAFLDDGDPRVAQLKSIYEDYIAAEGTASLGQTLHAENKGNIRGFQGDRPQVSDARNAKDLLNAQVSYIRNAHSWANQQEAVAGIKKLVSDPELREKQPNNVDYVNKYTKNAIGFGTNQHIRGIEDGLSRAMGVDRSSVVNALNHLRSYFYTKNLGLLNPKAFMVQMVQPAYVIPAMLDMQSMGVKVNPVKMAASTIYDFYHYVSGSREKMSKTSQEAIKYALDNGILSINVLEDTRDVGANSTLEKTKNVLNLNQTKAEEFGRATSYMMFVHGLENAGLKGEKLYRSAEAATNRVMVDYRKFEQPMWMESGGLLGRSAGTLKNFFQNNINQLYYYSQQALRGKPQGLAAFMGLQFALSGSLGLYGISTASDVYDEYLKPMLPGKMRDFSLKATALENMPNWFNYGLVSKATGLNLAGSFSMGDLVNSEGVTANVAPFLTDIIKTAKATVAVAGDPTNKEKWAQALYENLPPQGKGAMENLYPGFTSANGTSLNPRDTEKGMYKRDDFDRAVRYLGATSLAEASTKEKAYVARQREFQINEAKEAVREGYVQAQRNGDKEQMSEAIKTLGRWMGPDEIAKYLTQGVIQSATSRSQDTWQRQMPKQINNATTGMQYQRMRGLQNGPQ